MTKAASFFRSVMGWPAEFATQEYEFYGQDSWRIVRSDSHLRAALVHFDARL